MRKKESPIKLVRHDYDGNNSGYTPLENKVLVLPDYINETSDGGIVLTDDTVEQNDLAITDGYLIAFGAEAFQDWEHTDKSKIKPGMRVVWAIYSGQYVDGDDGKRYRLINDTDLAAIRSEP